MFSNALNLFFLVFFLLIVMSSVSNEDQLTLTKRPVKFYHPCGRLDGEPPRSVFTFP